MLEVLVQFPIGFFVALSGVLIPGPLMAYICLKTASSGARTGTLAALGHIVVELGILALIGLGVVHVIKARAFKASVGLLGGAVLVALGGIYLRRGRGRIDLGRAPVGVGRNPLLGGVLFSSVLNPSVPLWWATLGVMTFSKALLDAALAGAVMWMLGHFSADLGWFSLVSYLVARGRWMEWERGYKTLVVVCGGVLLLFGAYFLLSFILML